MGMLIMVNTIKYESIRKPLQGGTDVPKGLHGHTSRQHVPSCRGFLVGGNK